MLTESNFYAKYDHFVATFDTDKAVVAVVLPAVAAAAGKFLVPVGVPVAAIAAFAMIDAADAVVMVAAVAVLGTP